MQIRLGERTGVEHRQQASLRERVFSKHCLELDDQRARDAVRVSLIPGIPKRREGMSQRSNEMEGVHTPTVEWGAYAVSQRFGGCLSVDVGHLMRLGSALRTA